jgi:hypothetical protein
MRVDPDWRLHREGACCRKVRPLRAVTMTDYQHFIEFSCFARGSLFPSLRNVGEVKSMKIVK